MKLATEITLLLIDLSIWVYDIMLFGRFHV